MRRSITRGTAVAKVAAPPRYVSILPPNFFAMKTRLLSISLLFLFAFEHALACSSTSCTVVQTKGRLVVIAAMSADKPTKKGGAASPTTPASKPGEKQQKRPAPPAHLFM